MAPAQQPYAWLQHQAAVGDPRHVWCPEGLPGLKGTAAAGVNMPPLVGHAPRDAPPVVQAEPAAAAAAF